MNEELILSYIEKIKFGMQLEGTNLDFKREWWPLEGSLDDFLKDITSMANTHSGDSYILLGIDKTGNLFSAPFPFDEASIQEKLKDKIEPRVILSLEEVDMNGVIVSVVCVPHSNSRPHVIKRYKGGQNYIPVRFGSSTMPASRADLDEMYKERQSTESYNLKVEVIGGRVEWENYAGYEGNAFAVRLKVDNFDSNSPDYIVRVSLVEKSGVQWRGDHFKFDHLGLGKELEIPARKVIGDLTVYISDSPPEGLRNRRRRPDIDIDSLVLEISTRSGKPINIPIKPAWLAG